MTIPEHERRHAARLTDRPDKRASRAADGGGRGPEPRADAGGEQEPRKVTAAECAAIREARDGDVAVAVLAHRHGVSPRAVRYHARGECEHDPDREPAAAGGRGQDVEPATCAEWRRVVREYRAPAPALGERDGYAAATVRRHVRGECQHREPEGEEPAGWRS